MSINFAQQSLKSLCGIFHLDASKKYMIHGVTNNRTQITISYLSRKTKDIRVSELRKTLIYQLDSYKVEGGNFFHIFSCYSK